MILILVLALVVLGPDKLPQAGRTLGRAVRAVKKYVHDTTQELEEIQDLADVKKDVQDIQKDLSSMGRDLEKSIREEADAVKAKVETAEQGIQAAMEEELAEPLES